MLRGRPGGFRFNVDPVARMFETHSRIIFRSGMGARRPSLKCLRNALCVAITDSLFSKNVSTTKLRCSPDQPMASSENGKTAANQRDHSQHCTPSTARAVTPPKVGVISAAPCILYVKPYKENNGHPSFSCSCGWPLCISSSCLTTTIFIGLLGDISAPVFILFFQC